MGCGTLEQGHFRIGDSRGQTLSNLQGSKIRNN